MEKKKHKLCINVYMDTPRTRTGIKTLSDNSLVE